MEAWNTSEQENESEDGPKFWSSKRRLFPPSGNKNFSKGVELTLSTLFGIGAWLTVNSVFVQLPLLVREAPERWALPSHLSLAVQVANAGPILYVVLLRYCPRAQSFAARSYTVYFVLVLGALASIALAFTWDKPVGGKSWSIMVLTFCFALLGCTSSVLFIPFMSAFRPRSLAAYLTGEGIGGLLPGIIALIQGVGGEDSCDENGQPLQPDPLFSSGTFFICIFVIMLCSIVGFWLLERSGGMDTAQPEVYKEKKHRNYGGTSSQVKNADTAEKNNNKNPEPPTLGSKHLIGLLFMAGWVCLLANGFLPGIQCYSCGPYGNLAYHLAAILVAMSNPATCLLAFFTPLRKTFSLYDSRHPHLSLCIILGLATVVTTILSGLAITTAALSPIPPLSGTTAGGVLIVLIWTFLTVGAIYAKVGVAGALQEADSMEHGKTTGRGPLLLYGAVTQAGSAVGCLFSFLAVAEWNLFVAHSPC